MGTPRQASVMVCNLISIFIYLLAFTGAIGNLTVLFAFISNAIWHKVLQQLVRLIVSVAPVTLWLYSTNCSQQSSPLPAPVFSERGGAASSSTLVSGESKFPPLDKDPQT